VGEGYYSRKIGKETYIRSALFYKIIFHKIRLLVEVPNIVCCNRTKSNHQRPSRNHITFITEGTITEYLLIREALLSQNLDGKKSSR